FVCEGEKDADRLAGLELCATTVASGDWTEDCIKALAGRDCIILEDNDDAGRKKSLKAATALHGAAKTIRIRSFADLPEGGDASDWPDAAHGRDAEALTNFCFDAPLWEPEAAAEAGPATSTPQSDVVILTSKQFIAGFQPPDYIVDGLVQEGFLYSL